VGRGQNAGSGAAFGCRRRRPVTHPPTAPPAGPTAPPPAPFERARSAGSNGAGLGPGGGLVGVLWPVEAGRRYPKARRRYPKAGPCRAASTGKGAPGPPRGMHTDPKGVVRYNRYHRLWYVAAPPFGRRKRSNRAGKVPTGLKGINTVLYPSSVAIRAPKPILSTGLAAHPPMFLPCH
jgi:hypothetical protein